MKIKNIVCALAVFFTVAASAQETILHDDLNTWFTVLNRLTIDKQWSFSNEIHERTGAFLSQQGTFLVRPSIDYHPNENIEFSLGYSYILNEPNNPNPTPKINVTENNVWEQVLLKQTIGKVNFQHRIRLEHRWSDVVVPNAGSYAIDGTVFSNRFRYRLTVNTPIKTLANGQAIFFQAFDELWLPQTDMLMPKSFSRNWLYLGLGYKFSAKTNFQMGFMNQWDAIGANTYISTPILQTTFVRNFDL